MRDPMINTIFLALSMCIFSCTGLAAETSSITNYLVIGNTPAEIYAFIKTSAPRVAANPTFAYTTPFTKTDARPKQSGQICRYQSLKTSAFFVYTLPKHAKPAMMSKPTQVKWLAFVN